jgi:uncharacterized membrane protein
VLMAIPPTNIRIIFTNYDIIAYSLNLAFIPNLWISPLINIFGWKVQTSKAYSNTYQRVLSICQVDLFYRNFNILLENKNESKTITVTSTNIRIIFTNYDIIAYSLNLAFCSEHFISIKHRILAPFNINKKIQFWQPVCL